MENNGTAKTLGALVGQIAEFQRDGIVFHVRIVDARKSYGAVECRIEPLAGSGARWVRASSLRDLHTANEVAR